MKIEELQDRNTQTIGDIQETTKFSISEQAMGMFFKTFSDSLYSDKFGSIVREIASNCEDAHKKAGVTDKAIEIELYRPDMFSNANIKLVFRDFGTGMSPTLIKEVYSKYFESTKRDSNDEIGGWGIGAKSPFAYTDTFTVVTWVDNIKYTYVLHRSTQAPEIKLISTENEERENGTEVIIPVKSDEDVRKFRNAIYDQLPLFENINYLGFNDISNEYVIIKGKYFSTSFIGSTSKLSKLSIDLGGVKYNLNQELFMTELRSKDDKYHLKYLEDLPIAIRFNVGELPVTLSREGIEYKDGVIEKIVERYIQAFDELQAISKKQSFETEDLFEYLNLTQSGNLILHEKYSLKVPKSLVPMPSYKPFKGLPIIIPKDPFFDFEISSFIEHGQIKEYEYKGRRGYRSRVNYGLSVVDALVDKNKVLLRYHGRSRGKKHNTYLNDIFSDIIYLFKYKQLDEKVYEQKLFKHPNNLSFKEQNQLIELYKKEILKIVVTNTDSYHDEAVTPDEEWLKKYKEDNYKPSDKDKITLRSLWNGYDGLGYRIVNTTTKEIATFKNTIYVVAVSDEEEKLKELYRVAKQISRFDNYNFYKVAVATKAKLIEKVKLSNVITLEEFENRLSYEARKNYWGNKIYPYLNTPLASVPNNTKFRKDLNILKKAFNTATYGTVVESYFGKLKIENIERDLLFTYKPVGKSKHKQVFIGEVLNRVKEAADQTVIGHYLHPDFFSKDTYERLKHVLLDELTLKTKLYVNY